MLNCDSSGVLKIILLVKNAIQIIQIIAPIILVVMAMLDIVRLVVSNMEKTSSVIKKIINRFIAAIIVFLIPVILNFVLNLLGQSGIQSSACWINANEKHIKELEIQEKELSKAEEEAEELAQKLTQEQKDKAALTIRKAIQFADKSGAGDKNGGGVLLIAGHSPNQSECSSCNDCRGRNAGSGYAEEAETRLLALTVKKALLDAGINAVIANQVLTGDETDRNMEASFLCARAGSGGYAAVFQTLDNQGYWKNFDYVIEFHFNAGGGYGSELITNAGETNKVSNVANGILTGVSNFTGRNRGIQGFSGGTLGNWNYFQNTLGKDTTYLEVEFYDSKSAMDTYKANQNDISKAIADVIKKAS